MSIIKYTLNVPLDKSKEKQPFRTDRLAVFRNEYVRRINDLEIYSNINYVVVADLNNVNNLWKIFVKLNDCAQSWLGAYYDIYPLRHKVLNLFDCFEQKDYLIKFGENPELSSVASIYEKMIQISPDNDDSAFGGLAIYKKELFKGIAYCGLRESGKEVCE